MHAIKLLTLAVALLLPTLASAQGVPTFYARGGSTPLAPTPLGFVGVMQFGGTYTVVMTFLKPGVVEVRVSTSGAEEGIGAGWGSTSPTGLFVKGQGWYGTVGAKSSHWYDFTVR